MNDNDVFQVRTKKYFALLFFNAAREFLESAKADFAARRYFRYWQVNVDFSSTLDVRHGSRTSQQKRK